MTDQGNLFQRGRVEQRKEDIKREMRVLKNRKEFDDPMRKFLVHH